MTETFHIVPAASKVLWFLLPVMLVLLAIGVGLGTAVYATRHARFELSEQELRIHGEWLYARRVLVRDLRTQAAEVVDLNERRELQPRRRTAGTAVPGYRAGWFRLRNGDKALVYLTRRERVVHVPTQRGDHLLLSVTEPERMVASLRRLSR